MAVIALPRHQRSCFFCAQVLAKNTPPLLWIGSVDDGRSVWRPHRLVLRPTVRSQLSRRCHGLARAAKIKQAYALVRAEPLHGKPLPVQGFADALHLVSRPSSNLSRRSFDAPGVGIQRNRPEVLVTCARSAKPINNASVGDPDHIRTPLVRCELCIRQKN